MTTSFSQRLIWKRVTDYLKRYQPFLIGIAGTTGKTITRELISLALADHKSVLAPVIVNPTPRGTASALLGLSSQKNNAYQLLTRSFTREITQPEPEVIILELPSGRPGYVDQISRHLPFDVGILTNVGSTHLDYYHEPQNLAHEYQSLTSSLNPSTIALLNADDPLISSAQAHTQAHVYTYGKSPSADVKLKRSHRQKNLGFICEFEIHGQSIEVNLPHIIAKHHLSAIAAAFTCAHILQADLNSFATALTSYHPPRGRLQLLPGINDSHLLDDSYHATPETVLSALETLRAIPARRRLAVLGSLKHLAGRSSAHHKKLGHFASQMAHVLVVIGEEAAIAGAEALRAGRDVHHFQDVASAAKWLPGIIQSEDAVLVTGDRDLKLDSLIKRLHVNS